MARDVPPPTPEGVLIRRMRLAHRPRLSIPAAAELAGVSAETWGHLERGYKPTTRGQSPAPFTASPQIVAHAAHALGLTPDDLTKVGRDDAAELLATMQPPNLEVMHVPVDSGHMLIAVPPDLPEADREDLRRWAEQIAADLRRRRDGGT